MNPDLTLPFDVDEFQKHYVEMWNSVDDGRRSELIDLLFTSDTVHRLQPPTEMLEQARSLGFANPTLDVVGIRDMHFRVDRAVQEFIAPGNYAFRAVGRPHTVGDAVKVMWEMYDLSTGKAVGGGTDIFLIDGSGRITRSYQFIEPDDNPPS